MMLSFRAVRAENAAATLRRMKAMSAWFLAAALVGLGGCSAASPADSSGDGAAGASSGGTSATGGATGSGGTTGTGGATGTGGSATTGGTTGTGGSTPVDDCVIGTGTVDVGSDSFTDKATCLTWQKTHTLTGPTNNRDAAQYCNDLSQDGFDDWRLPTTQEIHSYPNLPAADNAYVTSPTFIASGAETVQARCTQDSHSCNLTQYNAGSFGCAWQGPGDNPYPVYCVRGTAKSALDAAFAVATCCSASSGFEQADCAGF
jgi:hypothetical protein